MSRRLPTSISRRGLVRFWTEDAHDLEDTRHTSSFGNHLFARADVEFVIMVTARKTRYVWYVCATHIPLPSASLKMFIQPMRNKVVPKLTDSVMMMLPSANDQPQIHARILW